MSAPAPPRAARRAEAKRIARARRATDFHVLRYVPGDSPIHRLWAGTKISALGMISIAVVLRPTWPTAGIAGALLLGAYLAARLPRGIVPHVPRWIWIGFVLGCVLSLYAGGAPYVHVGHARLGLGGLELWLRFSVIGAEIVAMAALIGWTTQLADLTPALGRLAGPLRRLRVPIEELIGAIGLSIRCLPLLLDEARVLAAARRARRPPVRGITAILEETEYMVFAALSNALRRARELGEAVEARGGVPTIGPEPHRLAWQDAVALGLTALSLIGIGLVG